MGRRERNGDLFEHSPADTFLLAAFGLHHWPRRPGACRVLDLGCGPARLLYEVALKRPEALLFGLEIQPELVEQAEDALGKRGMIVKRASKIEPEVPREKAITLIPGSARDIDSGLPGRFFDVVFLNPPYFRRGEGRIPPEPVRAGYRHETDETTLEDFLRAIDFLLAPAGAAFAVYPSSRMERLTAALGRTRLKMAARQDVYPNRSAKRPRWTLGRLVPPEHYQGTERLRPIRDPDEFMGWDREQEQEIAAG